MTAVNPYVLLTQAYATPNVCVRALIKPDAFVCTGICLNGINLLRIHWLNLEGKKEGCGGVRELINVHFRTSYLTAAIERK